MCPLSVSCLSFLGNLLVGVSVSVLCAISLSVLHRWDSCFLVTRNPYKAGPFGPTPAMYFCRSYAA